MGAAAPAATSAANVAFITGVFADDESDEDKDDFEVIGEMSLSQVLQVSRHTCSVQRTKRGLAPCLRSQ